VSWTKSPTPLLALPPLPDMQLSAWRDPFMLERPLASLAASLAGPAAAPPPPSAPRAPPSPQHRRAGRRRLSSADDAPELDGRLPLSQLTIEEATGGASEADGGAAPDGAGAAADADGGRQPAWRMMIGSGFKNRGGTALVYRSDRLREGASPACAAATLLSPPLACALSLSRPLAPSPPPCSHPRHGPRPAPSLA